MCSTAKTLQLKSFWRHIHIYNSSQLYMIKSYQDVELAQENSKADLEEHDHKNK